MYELNLTSASVIRLVDDPDVNDTIPDVHFDFIPLRDIFKHTNESFIGKLNLPVLHFLIVFSIKMLWALWKTVQM